MHMYAYFMTTEAAVFSDVMSMSGDSPVC